ncbi:ribosomal protection-like ABC-F family protein [Alkalicoccus urumqiensis]|uniref:ABC transporter n=1 Tax=Alkalicoccus urumqiensis TaxID=1548213 RepID=A0A2P6MI97_ALKUR|nr:ATP-binding cassette domain-containing protein [Alkalicoccus urumqiensis]PRO66015.1 ABC transporter [Alkalicoccus urumqiensis]
MYALLHEVAAGIPGRTLITCRHETIHAGDRIGLIGPNGCGKTTLMEKIASEQEGVTLYTDPVYVPQLHDESKPESGGETTKRLLRKAFRREGGLLLLDEPTTYLDTDGLEWLEEQLRSFNGAVLVISHDRAFLDAVCTKIWSVEDGEIHAMAGTYSTYKQEKEKKNLAHRRSYETQQQEKAKLERAVRMKEQRAEAVTSTKNVSRSEAKITGAKPYFAKKQKKMQQSGRAMKQRLEKLDTVEKPFEERPLQMTLPGSEKRRSGPAVRLEKSTAEAGGRTLWTSEAMSFSYGEHVAVTGPNGSGKTTFLQRLYEGIDIDVPAWLRFGRSVQDVRALETGGTMLEYVMAESIQPEETVRTVLARLGFRGERVYVPAAELSGGEKRKVSFAALFVSGCNALLLDEPTTFLDLEAVEALEGLIQEYPGLIFLVSHDRRFVERTADVVLDIRNGSLSVVEEADAPEDERLLLETRLSDVVSRLSTEPSPELEEEFQKLLKKKKQLET